MSYAEYEPWFRGWFGRSRVVEPSGLPLIVYHGTSAVSGPRRKPALGFEEFQFPANGCQLGVHFGTRRQAGKFGAAFPFYLSIENPLRLPDLGMWHYHNVIEHAREAGVDISERDYDRIFGASDRNDALRRLLTRAGHDGVIYQNDVEGNGASYIAFYPEQIRPARLAATVDTTVTTCELADGVSGRLAYWPAELANDEEEPTISRPR